MHFSAFSSSLVLSHEIGVCNEIIREAYPISFEDTVSGSAQNRKNKNEMMILSVCQIRRLFSLENKFS